MIVAMLTTIDNPFDPFNEFDQWFTFDESKGYHSCSLLDRIAIFSDGLTSEENARLIEKAIDEIVEINPNGLYQKVIRDIKNDRRLI